MKVMPVIPQYLRASVVGRPVGVDREAKILRGYVVAQEGPFRSEGRGEFDEKALREIVRLGNASRGGLKSRFTHPSASTDGLGRYLGRARNFTMSTATDARTGQTVKAVRGDLHFDPTAHETPNGDLASYVMNLAANDSEAISSSLVLKNTEEYRMVRGRRAADKDGNDLPPLWWPTELKASDIVEEGDAADALLSVPPLTDVLAGGEIPASLLRFDNIQRVSWHMLDHLFADQPREVVESRCTEYLSRYLSRRFGEPDEPAPTPRLNAMKAKMERMRSVVAAK